MSLVVKVVKPVEPLMPGSWMVWYLVEENGKIALFVVRILWRSIFVHLYLF
jgi:hypothetical protein